MGWRDLRTSAAPRERWRVLGSRGIYSTGRARTRRMILFCAMISQGTPHIT